MKKMQTLGLIAFALAAINGNAFSYQFGSSDSRLGAKLQSDEKLQQQLTPGMDFIRYALTDAGVAKHIEGLIFTESTKDYTMLTSQYGEARVVLIYLNPSWFNNLSRVEKWKYIAEIIVKVEKKATEPERNWFPTLAR